MKIVRLMTSPLGRGLRIVLGIVVIAAGLFAVGGTLGVIMALVGLVPMAGGVLDFCIISAVLGYGFKGANARTKLAGEPGHRPPPETAT